MKVGNEISCTDPKESQDYLGIVNPDEYIELFGEVDEA